MVDPSFFGNVFSTGCLTDVYDVCCHDIKRAIKVWPWFRIIHFNGNPCPISEKSWGNSMNSLSLCDC